MLIANARIASSPTAATRKNIGIYRGRMYFAEAARDAGGLDLEGYLLLPGLINAHDHLEFNLFPRLGRRTYENAAEWARDIYQPDQSPVREHLAIPKRDRLIWGGLRNLLSGVTTVAHHNPYDCGVFDGNFPVRVVRRFGWAHSIDFSPDLAALYRQCARHLPFIIHAAEGTDASARAEIDVLDRMEILGKSTVIVHGLALDERGLEVLARRGSSLVWCPSSNLLTYGATVQHREAVRTALGTDSAISAAGDMLDELRIAHCRCGASLESLYRMVTSAPAEILRLSRGTGGLVHGGPADFVAVADIGQTPAEALMNLIPHLVVIGGRIQLISRCLSERLDAESIAGFHSIVLESRGEWLIPFDIPQLLRDARAVLGPEVRLAGKRVSQ